MNIFIDLHIVSFLIAFVCITVMFFIWARYYLSLHGFLIVLGMSLTLVAAAQSDLRLEHIQAILLIGTTITILVAVGYLLLCARGRNRAARRRMRPLHIRQRPQALQFVEPEEDEPVVVRRSLRPARFPIPVEEERELALSGDEDYQDQDYRPPVRRPAPPSRQAAPRYVVNARGQRAQSVRRARFVRQGAGDE